ncbi:serine hydrolase [Colwellia sp. RSH04]|uniref:serine hydrolase domain-containing protein n=1 Tax=Colwellia sp. RSH04 TaxID=2305464 RepID=UPI0015FC110B|nr:serine hydrolase domain-containing protein [Colwellia sp. RSH04]
MNKIITITLNISILLLSSSLFAFENNAIQEKLNATINDSFEKLAVPGLSVAVVLEDGTSITATKGIAIMSSQVEVNETHLFRLASMSKHLTAIMVMMLHEQGHFGLNDRVSDYVELYNLPNKDKITIRQLLNHSAGVYDHINGANNFFDIALAQPNKVWTSAEILSYPEQYGADFEPGTSSNYSNTGYYILGLLIESITGQTLADAFDTLLTAPLALNNIFVDNYSTATLPIYGLAENNRAYEYHLSAIGAAGNFVATPNDLALLIHNVFTQNILSADSIAAMSSPSEQDVAYGLGTRLWTVQNVFHFGHTGTLGGYKSIMMYLPEQKMTIAITVNGYPANSADWWAFVDEIFIDVLSLGDSKVENPIVEEPDKVADKSSEGGSLSFSILFIMCLLIRKRI